MNVIDRKDEMPSTKTPLRYPGGKSQLTNFIYNTMKIRKIPFIVNLLLVVLAWPCHYY